MSEVYVSPNERAVSNYMRDETEYNIHHFQKLSGTLDKRQNKV